MNTEMIKEVTTWLQEIRESALQGNAEDISIFWFGDTKHSPFSIIAGWEFGFSKDYDDLLYISTEDPTFALCVKVAVNEGPYAYTDFEMMNMPVDKHGNADDTCIAIQRDENLSNLAEWLVSQWERITEEYRAD